MADAAMSLNGKRVIVIGGASGIGFAVAALAREIGAEVVLGVVYALAFDPDPVFEAPPIGAS